MTWLKRRRGWLLGTMGALLALGAATGLSLSRSSEVTAELERREPSQPRFESVARVRAVTVQRADLSLRREATGYLEPWRTVDVSADAPGRVVERRVEEGQWVEAGQQVVLLDDRDRRLEVEEAEAEWLKILAQYAVNYESEPGDTPNSRSADADTRSPNDLFRQGLISRQELKEARRQQRASERSRLLGGHRRDEVRAATSGLAQAEQRLERARLALERTRITAPFAGRVADLDVEPGQQVAPGEPLLTLIEDTRLKVEVDVLEADIVRLRDGAPAQVRVPALADTEFEGAIHTINPRVSTETGTGRVTVTLPNSKGRLMPGLFAYVELEVGRLNDRLQVPVEAVLERQDRQLVFRIEDGCALWTYVKTGARSGELVEIVEGLSEGDSVAVANHFALAHEAPVEVME